MKKKTVIIAACIAALLIAAGVGGWLSAKLTASGNKAGVDWYSESKKVYTITTAQELYDMAKLSRYYDFAGQTFKLGKDIVMNEGTPEDWGTNMPEYIWNNPIYQFAGTFDGQGHTISGVYAMGYDLAPLDHYYEKHPQVEYWSGKSLYLPTGMFAYTKDSCLIKNLNVTDSIFYNWSNNGGGSIVANGAGTLDTVYSNATVVAYWQNTGGLVGVAENGAFQLTNCWFDGEVRMEGEGRAMGGGGLIGTVKKASENTTISHCLNTANISNDFITDEPCIGGFAGILQDGAHLRIEDSLSAGAITADRNDSIGTAVGRLEGSATLAAENAYTNLDGYPAVIGYWGGSFQSYPIGLKKDCFMGENALQWTDLDYENYWTVVEGDAPVLRAFADQVSNETGAKKVYDISWYDDAKFEYTINTLDQLYGFYILSADHNFAGKTVKLGADITVNEGDAKDWAEKAPENPWYPINRFAGTFDGQGHTISGVYLHSNQPGTGLFTSTTDTGVLKNFRLVNSRFLNETYRISYMGSIVGCAEGMIDTVYSNAIIVSSAARTTGGIVGSAAGAETVTVNNCWFDGSIELVGKQASQSGGIVAGTLGGTAVRLQHCLNSGNISGGVLKGGLIGLVSNVVEITDCLNVGTIDGEKHVGAATSWISKKSTLSFENTYAAMESCINTVDNVQDEYTGGCMMIGKDYLTGSNAYCWTMLDFDEYWAIQPNSTPVLQSFAKSVPSLDGLTKKMDVSWYKVREKEYVLDSVEDLYGFTYLSYNTDFARKTVKLASNIQVNTGSAASWANSAPSNPWFPIYGFLGTFDGQGHTVSGLYLKSKSENPTGMFATTESQISNLRLTNSYFEKDGPYCGSVAGVFTGKLDHVYSNAIVKATGKERSRFGGLVGAITGEASLNECWFDGAVQANNNRYLGGLIGSLDNEAGTISVSHCLFSGSVQGRDHLGGLCGYLVDGGIIIDDSLSIGTLTTEGSTIGTLVGGRYSANPQIIIRNCAGVGKYDLAGTARAKEVTNSAKINSRDRDDLKGGEGLFLATWLDFNRHWVIRDTDTPVLRSMGGKLSKLQQSMENFQNSSKVDATGKRIYTIQNADDLNAFALLSRKTDYADSIVKLATDVTLNAGNAADWAKSAPANAWMSVGSASRPFAGAFDGQGHTISGLYLNKKSDDPTGLFAQTAASAVVKNLRIENSYFGKNGPYCGSVAGIFSGKLDHVYSNAIVDATGSGRSRFGGLVAAVTGDVSLNECWFDGTVHSGDNRYSGGLIGSLENKAGTVSVTHCLFSGTVIGKDQVGGICGYLVDGNIVIDDSMSVGTLTSEGKTIGTLVGGRYSATPTITLRNSTGVGAYDLAGSAVAKEVTNSAKINSKTAKQLTGAEGMFLSAWLDFANYWALRTSDVPALRSMTSDVHPLQASADKFRSSYTTDDSGRRIYTVSSASDFAAFAFLSRSMDFTNSTVKMTANVDMNPGWSADTETAPANRWTVIGSTSKPFAGTFDGQGHTIKGVYLNTAEQQTGLFAKTTATAALKDFRLENSCFITTAAYQGSIAGSFAGTAEKIYTNAIVHKTTGGNSRFGGLFGAIADGDATIRECWFNGTVNADGNQFVGGLIGSLDNAAGTVTVEHSMFSGTVIAKDQAGGLCGYLVDGHIVIDDTLSIGTITSAGGSVGSLVGGRYSATPTITVRNSVGVGSQNLTGSAAAKEVTNSAKVSSRTRDQLKGADGAFLAAWLDFSGHWMVQDSDIPMLRSLEKNVSPLQLAIEKFESSASPDTSGKVVYTVADADDLTTFALLSQSKDFADCTVLLAADIDLNPGWTASSTAPDNKWTTPIGSTAKPFAGTFDGRGHTISGVYRSTGTDNGLFVKTTSDAVLRDFRLENSYFVSTGAYGGTIAAHFAGTAEKIYSNATVHKTTSGNSRFGGLFGNIEGATAAISECWYAGTVSAIGNSYVGGLIGSLDSATDVTVEHCLFSGTVNGSQQVGGICGNAQAANSNITFEDTLSAGTISASQWGGLIGGRQTASSVLTANNSASLGSNKWYGNSGAYVQNNAANINSKTADQLKGDDGFWLDTWLDFDNYWVTRADGVPGLQSMVDGFHKQYTLDGEGKRVYTIAGTDDFCAFVQLSQSMSFADCTVLLAADIDLNPGWTASSTAPANQWTTPIGSTSKPFAGTFDGQGHTISGVYSNASAQFSGLFARTAATAELRNFCLTNSYFTSSAGRAGSIAGGFAGKAEKIYSNAYVNRTGGNVYGGFFGIVDGSASLTECWFDGTVYAKNTYYVGGLIGDLDAAGAVLTMEHCLFSGSFTGDGGDYQGGFIGFTYSGSSVSISDSASLCTFSASNNRGLFVGRNNTPLTIDHCVCANEYSTKTYVGSNASGGTQTVTNSDYYSTKKPSEFTGSDGLTLNNRLDFENYWTVRTDAIPTLKSLLVE